MMQFVDLITVVQSCVHRCTADRLTGRSIRNDPCHTLAFLGKDDHKAGYR